MVHIVGFILFCMICVVVYLARQVIKRSLEVQVQKIDNLETEVNQELQQEKSKHENSNQ